jgi:hypothetical protein
MRSLPVCTIVLNSAAVECPDTLLVIAKSCVEMLAFLKPGAGQPSALAISAEEGGAALIRR